jgi:MFS family permease
MNLAVTGLRLRSRLYRHADFRRLWAGQTVSQFGSQVSVLALPLVAVLVLHASAFRVSLLGMFDLLPFLLFALPAGAWVDRVARRPVLVGADVVRAFVLGSIPLAAGVGTSRSSSSAWSASSRGR